MCLRHEDEDQEHECVCNPPTWDEEANRAMNESLDRRG